jgi:hypothetical protein
MTSRTVLKHLVFKEHIECVLSGYGLWQPAWNFDVKILLSRSLSEHFFELIHEQLVFLLEIIEISVFIFDFPFLFFKLMFHGVGLILMNTIELIDLFPSISVHIIDLIFNKRVEFLLLSIPSNAIFPKFSSELFLTGLNKRNLLITGPNLLIFYLQVIVKFLNDLFVLLDLLLQVFQI